MLNTIRDEENNNLRVSIIIPCRNEENYIGKCLDSLIGNDYPKDLIEIFIIDGMSEDNTREIVKKYTKQYFFIKLIDNPKMITPIAMNIGIKEARGDIITFLSAHSTYPSNNIKESTLWIRKSKADNVGGICIAKPGTDSVTAKAIALVLSHPFGVGNSFFRIGSKELRYADTVSHGCYRREVFDKIGLFDEDLVRNQDDEFNLRLIKNGGKILLVPDIISYYYTRDSVYKLWKMYFQYGYFKPLVAKKVGGVLTWRQIIPSSFIGSIILALLLSFFTKFFLWLFLFILGLYTTVNFLISLIISIKKRDLKLLPFLIASFITLHFSYGFGYLKGIWDFIVFKKHLRKKIKDMPLTR